MKHTLPILVLVLGTLRAQDVEPTPDRAIASIVRELVSELPFRVPNGEALAIDPEAGSDRVLVERLLASLLREGFRIEARQRGASNAVPLRVATSESGRLGTIRVTAGDYVVARRFGRAGWVDAPKSDGTIVVVGAPSASATESLASAQKKLDADLRSRFPALAQTEAFERYAARQRTTSFVAERTVAGRKSYEAYVMVEPSLDRLARAERTVARENRRAPFVKSAAIGVAAVVLFVMYLGADWRTRGYRTARLRFVFGTLFVALSYGLWSHWL